MHRSGSTTRASDEFLLGSGLALAAGGRASLSPAPRSVAEIDHLPTYDPQSNAGRKEAQRSRIVQSSIHLIPVVLILCAFVLWIFSNPYVDLANGDDSSIVRIENMTIDGSGNLTESWSKIELDTAASAFQAGTEGNVGELDEKEP